MLHLIVHGNKKALKGLSRHEKLFAKQEEHEVYINSRGSLSKTLLIARFSQDAKSVKEAILNAAFDKDLDLMHDTFMECFTTQKAASFPSPQHRASVSLSGSAAPGCTLLPSRLATSSP